MQAAAAKQGPDFTAFASTTGGSLRGTAYAMCRDWHLAQDLTQVTLTKLYLGWARASQADNVEAYARTTLVRTYLDHRRRRSSAERTGALSSAEAMPAAPPHIDNPDLRLTVLGALAQLPAADRAVLVLRYWEDCSVERVAELLGIPVNTVKTRTRRSLIRLRAQLSSERAALYS